MIERISNQDRELALIIRSLYHKDGIEFFTPDTFQQIFFFVAVEQRFIDGDKLAMGHDFSTSRI
jgi:hypothetical protein